MAKPCTPQIHLNTGEFGPRGGAAASSKRPLDQVVFLLTGDRIRCLPHRQRRDPSSTGSGRLRCVLAMSSDLSHPHRALDVMAHPQRGASPAHRPWWCICSSSPCICVVQYVCLLSPLLSVDTGIVRVCAMCTCMYMYCIAHQCLQNNFFCVQNSV